MEALGETQEPLEELGIIRDIKSSAKFHISIKTIIGFIMTTSVVDDLRLEVL